MQTCGSMLEVRMDAELHQEATAVLAEFGLTAAEAVRLLFRRVSIDRNFALELKVPNAATRQAMAEAEMIVRHGRARFARSDELFAELDEAAAQ